MTPTRGTVCTAWMLTWSVPGSAQRTVPPLLQRVLLLPSPSNCLLPPPLRLLQIMLGVVTHEPHFSLLREEVRFGKRANESRQNSPEAQTFHLLHISILREYINHEFESLKVGGVECSVFCERTHCAVHCGTHDMLCSVWHVKPFLYGVCPAVCVHALFVMTMVLLPVLHKYHFILECS